jgi:8-oxo-dGTP pyrophosphatase MutT (NUDIX family)
MSNSCLNCNKPNHQFNQCKIPIISYGIIAFRPSLAGIQYLMICRKYTFGYIDYIRGKYPSYNMAQIQKNVDEMSSDEKQRLMVEPLDSDRGINEYIRASTTSWGEPEWEFPKGRRNYQESDLDCALREFEEETGYTSSCVNIIENMLPFEEVFIGSNHKSYKYKYYLAYMNENKVPVQNFQSSEVSKMEWKVLDECLNSIRPYNLEKKHVIQNINNVLQEYRLYS